MHESSEAEPHAAVEADSRTVAPGHLAAPAPAAGLRAQALWLQRSAGNRATARTLARKVELRKPGGKLPSAYERRAELVDRINQQTLGVLYKLGDDDRITYKVLGSLENFDTKMIEFIDAGDVLPLLLVTNEMRTFEGWKDGQGRLTILQNRLLVDDFASGVFDLDDMLRSTDESFQLNLIHVLTERLAVKDYEKKFPKNKLGPSFHPSHDAALKAELEHLRDMFSDPSIEYVGEWSDKSYVTGNDFGGWIVKGSGTSRFTFRSKNEGYEIVHELTLSTKGEQAGALWVTPKGAKKRMPAREFIEQRATATRN